MSDKVQLNSTFNRNLKKNYIIYTMDNDLVIESNKGINKIDVSSISKIILLNAKCPKLYKRLISYLLVFVASVFFVIGLFLKDNKIALAIFFILAAIIYILAGVVAKKMYSKAEDAIQMVIYKNGKKEMAIFGVNTTQKDYNSLQRISRMLKKENNNIVLDMQSRK